MTPLSDMSVEPCPKCGSADHVRPKLLATDLLFPKWVHAGLVLTWSFPFCGYEVLDERAFRSSPFVIGDHFVSALFCDRCDTGFIPDSRAAELGIGPMRWKD
jgi:hypothetical protein